jgi:hypothetical protein
VPLPTPPTPHFVQPGDPSTPDCPGTPEAPDAGPGQLCLYAQSTELTLTAFTNPVGAGTSSRLGVRVLFSNPLLSNITQGSGSWAARAQ